MRITESKLRRAIRKVVRRKLVEQYQSTTTQLEDMEHPSPEGEKLLKQRLEQLNWQASGANLDSYQGMPGFDPADEQARVKEKRQFLRDTYGEAYPNLPW